ncbi:MAG: biotin--[acetyl-CoA-carboxylase] ligase [Clostridia bacterium]|nr:biotin--[acetyl-CoA-carboxylase] ligase [Clostridia bacterium]
MDIVDNQMTIDLRQQGISMPCFCYIELASTNDTAKQLSTTYDKYVVLSRYQSKGRGRYNRSFLSSRDKGVYMSYCYNVPMNVDCSTLSAVVSLAVSKLLKLEYGVDSTIKWPNDVLVEGKKICGILNENIVNQHSRLIVLGLGLNVNYSMQELSAIDKPSTSLNMHTMRSISMQIITAQLINYVDAIVNQYNSYSRPLIQQYKSQCDIVGKRIGYDNGIYTVVDITDNLSLVVSNGTTSRTINYGEIVLTQ